MSKRGPFGVLIVAQFLLSAQETPARKSDPVISPQRKDILIGFERRRHGRYCTFSRTPASSPPSFQRDWKPPAFWSVVCGWHLQRLCKHSDRPADQCRDIHAVGFVR